MTFHLLDFRSLGALCGSRSGPVVSSPIVAADPCGLCLRLWSMYGRAEADALGPERPCAAHLMRFGGPPPPELAPELACPDRLFDWVACNGERGHEDWHWSWALGITWGATPAPAAAFAAPAKAGIPSSLTPASPRLWTIFADRVASVLTAWSRPSERRSERASGNTPTLASWIQPVAALGARGAAAWGRARGGLRALIRRAALKGRN